MAKGNNARKKETKKPKKDKDKKYRPRPRSLRSACRDGHGSSSVSLDDLECSEVPTMLPGGPLLWRSLADVERIIVAM